MSARDELRDHLVSGVNWGADELIDAYGDEVRREVLDEQAPTSRRPSKKPRSCTAACATAS